MKSRSVLLGVLGVLLGAMACNDGKGKGNGSDLSPPPDGQSAINLTITIVGDGAVEANGQEICSALTDPCTLNVTLGGSTTVEAVPGAGSQFQSWSCDGQVSTMPVLGLGLSSGASCTVTFAKLSESLMVNVTDGRGGTGGVVTSTEGGIACGTGTTTCTAALEWGTKTTLTAAADEFYRFVEWTGDCNGTQPSVDVTIKSAVNCTAQFEHVQFQLTLNVVGEGTVTTSSATTPPTDPLACSTGNTGTCGPQLIDTPAVVTLTATPAANYRIGAWTGDCAALASDTTTTLTMDVARTCAVTFVLVDRLLVTNTMGGGTITVSPEGTIVDGGRSFTHGDVVELTAIPDENKIFIGWSGDCGGTEPSITLTMDGDKNCAATFAPTPRQLTVSVVGPGSVTSAPTGIDTAASATSATYDHGTEVVLTASPATNYEVAGWSGDCSGTATTASVTLDADKACVVTFQLVKHPLVVTVIGSGSVTSAPTGIDTLAGAYQALFVYDTDVLLTATANTGATQISFVGWSGDCSGTALTATVDLTTARACTAEFTITPYDLAVAVAPSGSGNVVGQRNGTGANVITCGDGADCSETNIPSNENVVLTATPKSGFRFDRWSGCSNATTATLTVPMNTNKSCTANFVEQWNLTVARQLTNGAAIPATLDPGTISGSGVDCGADCARPTIDDGATVTLTATTNAGFVWKGWSGTATGCSGTATSVAVGSGGTPGATYTCTGTWDQTAQVAAAITPSEVGTVTGAATIVVGGNGVGTTTTLTRPASSGSYNFTGWSGAFTRGSGTATGCSGTGTTATIAITAASADAIYTCTASYGTLWNLAVGKSLTSGSATVDPGAVTASGTINCGADCSENGLASTATITLTAPTPAGFVFRGWTGTATGCSGTTANVTVSYGGTPGTTYTCNASWDQTASVVGAANPVAVGSVTGGGTVTVGGTGVGTTVVLTRPASSGSYAFTSWSGAFTSGSGSATGCSGTGANATVQITSSSANAVYTCTASYTTQWNLTVAKSLTSGATITAALDPGTISGTGISCGSDCNENAIAAATNITLTATTVPGFVWKGWTGTATGCSGVATNVTISYGGTPGATYTCNPSWDQVATVVGAASPVAVGAVSGGGSVIVGDVTTGTSVTLTRPANSGSYSLTSWSGAFTSGGGTATGCSGTGASVTVRISDATANAIYTCTASYNTLWNLTVSKSLSNGATITTGFDPGAVTGTGINCGADCSESGINATASVTLDAPVGGSFAFRRWTGTATGCSGTAPSVTVSSGGVAGTTYTCNAEWDETATVVGVASPAAVGAIGGGGTVIVGDATTGTTVTLTKPANNGTYRFTSWSGAFTTGSGTATGCTGSGATATVRITSATAGAVYTCTASYDSLWNLTVAKTLTNGAVVSATLDPGAVTASGTINCGADCSENGLGSATTIQLSAPTTSAGFAFVGWSGTASGCTGNTPTITVATGGTPGTTYTCNPSWNQTATVVGTANPTAAGSVTGGGTVVVGSTPANAVTLSRPASSGSYNFTGWSGTFTQGTGAATGCTGTGNTTTVAITSASADAIFTCTATYGSLWNLSVAKSLTNGVAVPTTLDPGAVTGGSINCGATCTQSGIASATNITLTAPTPAGYTFRGWSGTATGCSGVTAAVTVSSGGTAGTTYTCNASWDQTATVVGAASPAAVGAITGGTSVVVGGPNATTATLSRPAASSSYAFVGWSGTFTSGSGVATGCSGTGLTANVSITSATNNATYTCTATYNALWNLSVGKSLTNGATISGALDPGAVTATGTINCGADCSENGLTAATTIQLTAPTSSAGFTFVGWTGTASGCSGATSPITVGTGGTAGTTYTCNASWNQTASVVGATSPAAAGAVSGGGTVVVGSTPANTLTLTRPASTGSYNFTGWSGTFTQGSGVATGCSGTGTTTTVTITSASANAIFTCTASYDSLWNLTVGKSLTNGSATLDPGTITGTIAGPSTIVSCGADCAQNGIKTTATVTLTAPNAPSGGGYVFLGWTGTASGCSGTAASIDVTYGGTAGATYSCNASWRQEASIVGAASPVAAGTVSGGGTFVVGPSGVGTTATLTRPAPSGYQFTGWSGTFTTGSGAVAAGSCSGTGVTTTVRLDSATAGAVYTCTASFNILWSLSVGKTLSNGAALDPGAVTGTGINCGADCSETNLISTTTVALTAPATSTSYTFRGWSGTASGCSGTTNPVTVGYNGTPGTTYTCNALYDQNVTILGVGSPAAGSSGVTPASTTATVGSSPTGTQVTIDRGTLTSLYRFVGWSGAFNSGSGTVEAGSCTGTGATTTVRVLTATSGATYRCNAVFQQRGTVTVTAGANGSATVANTTPPVSDPNYCAPGASCTVDASTTVQLNATPNSGYRFLNWTGATCSVASTTAASTTLTVAGGSTYACTANFRRIYNINVRVVPAPTAVDRFGSVSAPCTVSTTQSSCATTVDTGSSITLNAAEYLVSAQRHSRFVRWICTNGTETTAITGQTITNITSDITCVAQFYGLWSRYYQTAPPSLNSAPNVVDLPIATLPADGLPNSSSHFVVDGNELTSPLSEAAAFVAADNEVNFPALSNRGVPTSAFSVNRTLTNGVEEITTIGRHTLSPGSGDAARYRAAFWPFGITRSATTGVENALTREDFTEYTWVAPIVGGFTLFWDSYLQNGAYRAGTGYALGGTRGLTYRYAAGSEFLYQTANYGWVFRTDKVGTPQQSTRFAVPANYENGTCATEQATNVLDVMWDTDPANVGGVVAVGTYTTSQNNTYSFIAKFNSALTLLAPGIRTLVPSGNGNLSASSIVPAIGGGQYAVFGTFTNNTVAMMLISYNLGSIALDDSYSITNAGTGAAMTTVFGDVVAETNRYVVVGGVFDGTQYDTQAMFFAADGTPQGGMQIGSPTLWELASRIIKPRDGGYLIGGTGYLSMTAPLAAGYWLTRTDENFFVPFNGNAPSNASQTIPPARIGRGDLKLTGASLPCPAAWFDNVLPTVNTATATESSFNATVTVQAP